MSGGGDERLLSDDEVAKVRASTVAAMRAAGIRLAVVYAYERCGLIVTRVFPLVQIRGGNQRVLAIAEYRERGA